MLWLLSTVRVIRYQSDSNVCLAGALAVFKYPLQRSLVYRLQCSKHALRCKWYFSQANAGSLHAGERHEAAAEVFEQVYGDRVPVDMGSSLTTSIMVTAYARLRRELGVNGTPPRVSDLLQMLAEAFHRPLVR